VKCIRFALYLILLSQTRQAAGHISSDQYEGGTNEDPIHTGEHDAVAVALTRSSGALRAYPRPCLSHLRVHPVFIRLSELGSPDPPTSTPRARFVRPPTAHDAAAFAANPSIAPRDAAYSPRRYFRFCRPRPGARCAVPPYTNDKKCQRSQRQRGRKSPCGAHR
jgi:hypothetical protein